MGQFGKIGSISINELNSILLSLTCRNEELYLAASPDKADLQNTELYSATYQQLEKVMREAIALEQEAKSQKVTRKGVQYNGTWYFSNELGLHIGEKVVVNPEGKYLEVTSIDGKFIDGIPMKKRRSQ